MNAALHCNRHKLNMFKIEYFMRTNGNAALLVFVCLYYRLCAK